MDQLLVLFITVAALTGLGLASPGAWTPAIPCPTTIAADRTGGPP
jgi:hypothetical protein